MRTVPLRDMTVEQMDVAQIASRLAGLCACDMCIASRHRATHGTEPALDTTNATTAAVAPPNSGNK